LNIFIKFDKISRKEDYILDNFLNFYTSHIKNKFPSEFNFRYFNYKGFKFELSMGKSYNNTDQPNSCSYILKIKSDNKEVFDFFNLTDAFNDSVLHSIISCYIQKLISEKLISSFSIFDNNVHNIIKLKNEEKYGFVTRSAINFLEFKFKSPFYNTNINSESTTPAYLDSSLVLLNGKFYPHYSLSFPILPKENKFLFFNFLLNDEKPEFIIERFNSILDKDIFDCKYKEMKKLYNISKKEYISDKLSYDSIFETYHH